SEEIVSQSSWVYLEGYLLASPAGREAIFRAVELAQKFGVKSALTFSDGFIVDAFGSTIEELTAKVDLVFANFTEASKFTGAADEAEVIRRMKKSVKQGVVTLGADGAEVWYAGTSDRLPGFKASAIDLTGAGDMFAGGFLFGITHGLTSRDSAVLACFLASKVVSQLGPRLNENPRKLALDAGLLSG
ncbi:MAG TPA: PfkB family carbohydrate kinase, partial [Oligoflexia bacterium]|nr:PfkB family carbohydrate kinase [Oligoflexia bacterium]